MKDGKRIVFKELVLEGFGTYERETVFTFSEGSNTYIAANESGKSTIFAGILAVLFGLSHRLNASSLFHLERYRNWNQPLHCRGSLSIVSDQILYRIERNFDTHKLTVYMEPQGILFEGIHNPEGKKPLLAYENLLLELFAIKDKELFEATFFVMQPLPEANQLDAGIQGLLSGGSKSTFDEALSNLQNQLRLLTKYIGPNHRGIANRNGAKEGELEVLSLRIDELETKLQSGKDSADELVETQEESILLKKTIDQLQEEISEKERLSLAWKKWFQLRKEYHQVGQSRDHLATAYHTALRYEHEKEEIKERIDREYSHFHGVATDFETSLLKLEQFHEEHEKKSDFYPKKEVNKISILGILAFSVGVGLLSYFLSNQMVVGIIVGVLSFFAILFILPKRMGHTQDLRRVYDQNQLKKADEIENKYKEIVLLQEYDRKQAQISALLSAMQVEHMEHFQTKFRQAEEVSLLKLMEWKKHCEEHPSLASYEHSHEVGRFEADLLRIEEETGKLKHELQVQMEKERQVHQKLGLLHGNRLLHIAEAELELEELRQEEESLLLQADALTEAYLELDSSIKEYSHSYHQLLTREASRYFSRISKNEHREIRFDEGFKIEVWEKGRNIVLQSLSKGARDQMYLAIRMAIADFLSKDWKIPFFFDDSFVHIDQERNALLRTIFEEMKQERQLFLFSHSRSYQEWGSAITIQKGAIQ